MASLGADTFTQQQIRQSANRALKSADNSVSKEIKEELARVGGKVDDAVSKNIIGKYSLANINKETGFIDLLPNLLKKEDLTMDDFHYLMQKNVNALTQSEIQKLTNIRNAIPKPDANTLMQKVIPADDIDMYLSGQYFEVGGSVAKASDTKHLKSFEDYYYYGLRLDYIGTKFHISKNSCGVIRFKSKEITEKIVIPKGGTFDEWDYPFTSTGFTSGNQGRLGVPEWNLLKRINFNEGDEIWEIFNDGEEILKAIYSKGDKKFIIVK
ncbi:hypothetical protein CAPN004_11450 [Capnocytophaga cynodegmi]|uniref:hypothetical protein n=1 Tax=Capnocytophaga cynodegmi TaxID=28189 RepID=UPI001AC14A0E|nr:hypothetical protein [Capnocytophaga cynodegmi]GIM52115.1 hypothetical protein CAPN004_11450 [Capnocytophaga cynodegmi]